MTRTEWRLRSQELQEREKDYTAAFTATNIGTGQSVTITLTQPKGEPASVLIGGCRALANLLEKASRDELDDDGGPVGRMH